MRMAVIVSGVLMAMAGAAQAAEIKVLGTPGVREFYVELGAQFEKATGHKLRTEWAGNADVTKRIGGGETVDLVIMAAEPLDDLAKRGKIVSDSRVNVARSGVAVAVRAGAPKPDISSGQALKKTLLATKSIAYSAGPSGLYIAALVKQMGIADEIKSKMRQVLPGEAVGELVARGDAEIGFHQMSELLPVKGIDIIGPLSPDVQKITVFAAGIHAGAKEADAAQALIKFITAPAAVPVIKKHGMEPG